jgi:hypothetical protein
VVGLGGGLRSSGDPVTGVAGVGYMNRRSGWLA